MARTLKRERESARTLERERIIGRGVRERRRGQGPRRER